MPAGTPICNIFFNSALDMDNCFSSKRNTPFHGSGKNDDTGIDDVGNHGRDGDTCHTHFEFDDQKEIQSHINGSGHHQTVKRPFGIAEAPENRRPEIVYHHERHSQRNRCEDKVRQGR